MTDPTQRFSNRVENYIKYRPAYPDQVLEVLRRDSGLAPEWVIADIGSGTGILTELFLKNGNPVFAVEPNREMREAAERLLAGYPRFRSIDGRAEATTLPDRSTDLIVCGQSFHWFDREKTREEFSRILRPAGWVVLLWNERETAKTPFLEEFEKLLLRFATDYAQVDHRKVNEEVIARFFLPGTYRSAVFGNEQVFDLEGLRGRLLSSSFAPAPDHPDYGPMLAELERMFHDHQKAGRVTMLYRTKMYYGRLG